MATWQLEQFLRKTLGVQRGPTVKGIGPGSWDSGALARNQERFSGHPKTVYRIYTEDAFADSAELSELVKRYFDGATILYGTGLDGRTQNTDEQAVIIEVITSKPDALQRILNLAGDIRELNAQVSVLVTRQDVKTFEVTLESVTKGAL